MSTKGHVIWIEGVMGAGKSTLTGALAWRLNYRAIDEPVESNFVLEPFYKDPEKYGFVMQMHLLMVRYNAQLAAAAEAIGCLGYDGAIIDRGLPGDRVFAQLFLTDIEWRVYEHAYNIMSSSLRPPSLLVYLDVEPEEALRRVQERGRKCEAGITLSYLEDLHKGYDSMLKEIESHKHAWSRGINVLRIPWTQPHLPVDGVIESVIDALKG